MPVPKGVSPKKFDDCVEEIKSKQGGKAEGKVNAYAACNAALKSQIAKQEGAPSAMDQMAYKECVEQEKRAGSSNPYAICRWRTGKQKGSATAAAPAQKSDAEQNNMKKQENELDWGHWGKPVREELSLLDTVERKPVEEEKNRQGNRKEETIFDDFLKGQQMFQGPWENSKKMIRKQPKMKPPMRPGEKGPKSVKISEPSHADKPTMHFKEPLTMKSESAIVELKAGMSFAQLQKMENEALMKQRK